MTTLLVIIFYGGKVSFLSLPTEDAVTCEKTYGLVAEKVTRDMTYGRIEHLCLRGVVLGGRAPAP